MPSVTVILTSYNHEQYVRDAIDSVLNQSFTDFELIILDDASSDGSWKLIREFSDDRIRAFRYDKHTGGTVGANNVIAELASGQFIAIHHSDDIWEPDKLEKQVGFLERHSDIAAVFTKATIIREDGSPLIDRNHYYWDIFEEENKTRHEWLRFFFRTGNALCHPSVLIRKSCYERVGLFKLGLWQLQDMDLWIRVCLSHEIYVLPEKLIRFRMRGNDANVSGNRADTRIRTAYEIYNLLQNYRKLTNLPDLIKVFPSAREYDRDDRTDMSFALGMIALEELSHPATRLFGQELLFEALSDPNRAENIKDQYNFDEVSFSTLTGRHDIFSIEEVAILRQAVADRDTQIADLNHSLAECGRQATTLINSIAERDERITGLDQFLANHDRQISKLISSISERDRQIAEPRSLRRGERITNKEPRGFYRKSPQKLELANNRTASFCETRAFGRSSSVFGGGVQAHNVQSWIT